VSEAYEAITRAQRARVVVAVTRQSGDLDIADYAATDDRSGEATGPDPGPSHNEQRETRSRQATGPSNAVGEIWERTTRNNGLETGPTRDPAKSFMRFEAV
jgi:hypothetical protein